MHEPPEPISTNFFLYLLSFLSTIASVATNTSPLIFIAGGVVLLVVVVAVVVVLIAFVYSRKKSKNVQNNQSKSNHGSTCKSNIVSPLKMIIKIDYLSCIFIITVTDIVKIYPAFLFSTC